MEKKICTKCQIEKPLTSFAPKGGKYFSSQCHDCDAARMRERRRIHGRGNECPVKKAKRVLRQNERARIDRANNRRLGQFVLTDCRNSDRKKGRVCDLDRAFVEDMMTLPCACGNTIANSKMTLDRKDNDLGHIKTNVVTTCYRCNLLRGDMPYEAWRMLIPAIKQVNESGAFGDWKLWPRTNRPSKTTPDDLARLDDLVARPTTQAGGRVNKITDEEYLEALRSSPSICQALIKLGLAPKGKNYARAKRLLGIDGKMSTKNNNLIGLIDKIVSLTDK